MAAMHDVLVIGIAVADAIARPVDVFPEPGGLRLFDELTLATGGCAVNAATALARLGVGCDVITRIGTDGFGDFVLRELTKHGLDVRGVVRDARLPTSFSFVAVASNGERSFIHTRGANAALSRTDVPTHTLHGRRFVFVAGTMLMDSLDGDPTAALLADARAQGATTLLDTVHLESATPADWDRRVAPALPHIDYFVPSLPEALKITRCSDVGDAAIALHRLGARHVVVKLGERGAFVHERGKEATIVPPWPVPAVVDATGAGDCWCAGFIAGLREGLDTRAAVSLGNAVAALGIQAPGASNGVPPLADVRAFMERARRAP